MGRTGNQRLARSGAGYLAGAPHLFAVESPFDYANQAEVLIVTDVPRGDIAALAAAYARLIEAAGGGVLGLFTAIRRLRVVHGRIVDRLARDGLPLYAQHVDPIDTGTLVDIFRRSSRFALGTDALRDRVDVPGESLRVVVMEQVPAQAIDPAPCTPTGGRREGQTGTRIAQQWRPGARRRHHPGLAGTGLWPPDPLGRGPRSFRRTVWPSIAAVERFSGKPVRRVTFRCRFTKYRRRCFWNSPRHPRPCRGRHT
jgi:hypothetical protein